ncbi:MAG: rRNA maturation RNase YbeY [Candidatus Omnitrophica bacterium]|nr:rRNA maturation RNase YbeY [Candidatus Omnitrophota bacterium]
MTASAGVTVRNLDTSCRLNEKLLSKIAARCARLATKKRAELDIVFVDARAMRRLNKRYKGSSRLTDVLSFKMGIEGRGVKRFVGAIAVCPCAARKNAKAFGTRFEEELALYVIHGILHLYGYDDVTKAGRERMSKRQNAILRKICESVGLSKVSMPR